MRDYKLGKIYKLTILDNKDLVYYGSTIQSLSVRLAGHKGHYKRWKAGKTNYVSSFKLFETGKYVMIKLVEVFPCETKYELEARERFWIENYECVNKCVPGRTKKEYYKANANKIKEYRKVNADEIKEYIKANADKIKKQKKEYYKTNADKIKKQQKEYRKANANKIKEYYKANADKIKKQQKEYRKANADKIKECSKEYYKKNADKLKKQKKEYYKTNADKIKEYRKANADKIKQKIKCEFCGCSVRKDSLKRHQRSIKCKSFQNI